jgi:hypothetical protein
VDLTADERAGDQVRVAGLLSHPAAVPYPSGDRNATLNELNWSGVSGAITGFLTLQPSSRDLRVQIGPSAVQANQLLFSPHRYASLSVPEFRIVFREAVGVVYKQLIEIGQHARAVTSVLPPALNAASYNVT